jgi:hypothetical protein
MPRVRNEGTSLASRASESARANEKRGAADDVDRRVAAVRIDSLSSLLLRPLSVLLLRLLLLLRLVLLLLLLPPRGAGVPGVADTARRVSPPAPMRVPPAAAACVKRTARGVSERAREAKRWSLFSAEGGERRPADSASATPYATRAGGDVKARMGVRGRPVNPLPAAASHPALPVTTSSSL